jgi:hypothetical protein
MNFASFLRLVLVLYFVPFGSIETPKSAVSIWKRNNRTKHLVSDSIEISFGWIESKLVSQDTLYVRK